MVGEKTWVGREGFGVGVPDSAPERARATFFRESESSRTPLDSIALSGWDRSYIMKRSLTSCVLRVMVVNESKQQRIGLCTRGYLN